MKGIVFATHGEFAKGLITSLNMFFSGLQQCEAVCLAEGENPDDYAQRLVEAIQAVDSGDGTMVFCDIAYGTPCNSVMKNLKNFDLDKIDVVSGVNLPMMLQALSMREAGDIVIEDILKAGNEGITDIKGLIVERVKNRQNA